MAVAGLLVHSLALCITHCTASHPVQDSGEFGEVSLTPPPFCSPRHLKNNNMMMLHKDTSKLLNMFKLESTPR